MSKRTLLIANWKMNFTTGEASLFTHKLNREITNHRNVEMVLAPSILALPTLNLQIDHRKFRLAAQNLYWRDEGAYTGEVSAHQLHGLVKYAIIGHSERRHIFKEHDKDIRAKVQAAVRNDIIPVLCVGETAAEKTAGETTAILHDQITAGVANLTAEEIETMVIAYEPVWAISSGKNFASHATPTTRDIEKVAKNIRSVIEHLYGKKAAKAIRVLYGGSVSSSNATTFLQSLAIDGFLIGGASLRINEFQAIVEAAYTRDKGK